MERLMGTWGALDMRRRIIVAGAVIASIVAIALLGQMATRPGMSLLYSGLDPAAAGELIGALEQMGVQSEVRGDAIFVPSPERDRVRLALARDGMPRQGQEGYELLDRISGFSVTSDMFDAAYWRAKEGELARTILASPRVRAARVHIATPARRPFSRGAPEQSATVTATMAGGTLTPDEAMAFRYLVALSVPGLAPEQVAVIDSRAGLVLGPGENDPSLAMTANAAAREAHLQRQIEDLLAARVGPGKARVSVSLDTERVRETVTERILEPGSRVVIHTDTEEIADTSRGGGGAVTIASNLPDGDAARPPGPESNRTETRERANYDYSEVRRERTTEPGAIRRMTVAVLVDGITVTDAAGASQWQPRPPEELAALRQLVTSAIGFDEARGDVVTVESMAFLPPPDQGTLVEGGWHERFLEQNAMTLAQLVVLAIVVIVLALTVIRPMLVRPPQSEQALLAQAAAATAGDPPAEEVAGLDDRLFNLPDRETLRQAVTEFPDQSLATLRDWLDQVDEEAA